MAGGSQIGMIIAEVESAISQYNTQVDAIDSTLQKITSIVAGLEAGWWGQAEDKHQELMSLWNSKQTEIKNDLSSVITKVQASLARLEETDSTSAATFNSF